MSRPKTIGLAIVARLEEIEELTGKVFFYQTTNVEDEFTKRMGKAKGKAVIVRLVKAKNIAKDRRTVRWGGFYTISLITLPILNAKDAKDSDALMQEITDKIHGWWPEEVPSNGMDYCGVDEADFPSDPDQPRESRYEASVLAVTAPFQPGS